MIWVIVMKRVTKIVNGIVTLVGLALDIYGVLNLSPEIALIGATLGVCDLLVFIWMAKVYK